MKRLLSLLLLAAIAYGTTSCASPEDIFDEYGPDDSTDNEATTNDSTRNCSGTTTLTLDGEVVYTINDVSMTLYRDFDEDLAKLTLRNFQVSDEMTSRTIVFSDVPQQESVREYKIDEITPTTTSGDEYTDITTTNLLIEVTGDDITVTFTCEYELVSYTVVYFGDIIEEESDDEEEEEPEEPEEPTIEGYYAGEFVVENSGGGVTYTDDNVEIAIVKDIIVDFNDETGYAEATDIIDLTISGVQFTSDMPETDLVFENVVANLVDFEYNADSITPTTAEGDGITYLTSVTNLIVTMDSDLIIRISFTCEYNGVIYNVTYISE